MATSARPIPNPEWGQNDRRYEVYVQYSAAVKDAIPPDCDGVILSLTEAGMDRSVSELLESDIKLPWWWVYGRRIRSRKKAPNSRSVLSCDRVSKVLPLELNSAKQRLQYTLARKDVLEKHRQKSVPSSARAWPNRGCGLKRGMPRTPTRLRTLSLPERPMLRSSCSRRKSARSCR